MNTATLPATVTIGSVQIHQYGGLYSLNDLHKASGGEERHKPVHFFKNAQTQSLIDELHKVENPTFKTTRGKYASTYACRELVIAYAAWISAEFHLRVIRVFLDNADKMTANRPAALPPPPVRTRTLTFTVPEGDTGQRWLLHTDRMGREIVTPLTPDTHIATPAKIVDVLMKSPADLHVTYAQQLTIVSACLRNLHQAAAGHAKRLNLKPGLPPIGARP